MSLFGRGFYSPRHIGCLDFLGAAAEGPISIELKDEQSAGQMRPLADESYRYRHIIIMPMRSGPDFEIPHE